MLYRYRSIVPVRIHLILLCRYGGVSLGARRSFTIITHVLTSHFACQSVRPIA